ncbi:MAG TPA: hypothetical protein V6D47_03270, partial [Oscillatoriaceae cyanobacterium]
EPLIDRLQSLLSDRPVALVGGCVRDWLLGRQPIDWDLVVEGDPAPVADAIAQALKAPRVLLDAEFGVWRVAVRDGVSLDVVRQQGPTLEADLTRRDLTINAIAWRLSDGRLADPAGGLADLDRRILRAVSALNIESDPLRVLRIFRFESSLGWPIEPVTRSWAERYAPQLAGMAAERILVELDKLIRGAQAPQALEDAIAVGAVRALWPELDATRAAAAFARLHAWRASADARTRDALEQGLAGDRPAFTALALGIWLHSLGTGAEEAIERLKLSSREAAWVRAVATEPLDELAGAGTRALYRVDTRLGERMPAVAIAAWAYGAATPEWRDEALMRHWHWEALRQNRLLTGNALMHALDLSPGPRVGELLAAIEEARALGELGTPDEALARAASMLARGE